MRDERGARLGRVQDIGFSAGEIRFVATERGVFEARARVGTRLIAGTRTKSQGVWLSRRPRLLDASSRAVRDLVLGSGLAAPLYVVSRGLVHDLLHGRELVPASRADCREITHELSGLR